MLVFTRKRDEAIVIGDGIEVRVLRVGKDGVRLGIVAPRAVTVHRREVYDAVVAANKSAAQAPEDPGGVAARVRRRLPGGIASEPPGAEKAATRSAHTPT